MQKKKKTQRIINQSLQWAWAYMQKSSIKFWKLNSTAYQKDNITCMLSLIASKGSKYASTYANYEM
jgi:hypothetical protein